MHFMHPLLVNISQGKLFNIFNQMKLEYTYTQRDPLYDEIIMEDMIFSIFFTFLIFLSLFGLNIQKKYAIF